MGSGKPRILYFVPEWQAFTSPILHAQVLSPARYLSQNGFTCMFVGNDISEERAAYASKRISSSYGIETRIFGCYPLKPSPVSLFAASNKVSWLARSLIDAYKPTCLYTRDAFTALTVRKRAARHNAVSIFDIRGLMEAGVTMHRGKGLRSRASSWFDLNAIRKADRLACVSYRLKELVKREFHRDDIVVIPSCVDTDRFFFDSQLRTQIRQQYQLADTDKVICYAGGLSKWQRIPDIIRLFEELSRARQDFRFLFLTRQYDELNRLLKQANLPLERYIIESCSHDQVPSYFSAADAGIIMRDDILVNNIASPIKIGEYLSCSLPVILTKGIGDYSEWLPRAGVGLVLQEDKNMVRQVVDFMEDPNFADRRERAIEFCQQNLSFKSHLDHYRRLFSVQS